MRNPLKQGLKHVSNRCLASANECRNAKSTKTRIETHILYGCACLGFVAMRNPLKQGLKLISKQPKIRNSKVAMRNPLKQGLKHFRPFSDEWFIHVAMRNPLKQGLKQRII